MNQRERRLLSSLAAGLGLFSFAASADLTFRSRYQAMEEPLTTERVWALEHDERNPHRLRWLVTRHVDLKGFQPRPMGKNPAKDGYGVTATSVEATAHGYVRGPGPWYRDYAEFSCKSEPQDSFATEEGSRRAAAAAALAWEDLLRSERIKLSVLLGKVRGGTPEMAMDRGDRAFRRWLREMESEWRAKGMRAARMAEWRHYLETANSMGQCKAAAQAKRPPAPSWQDMMEPPPAGPATPLNASRMLARAPAKRWNGLFSIRASVMIGGKTLNGQFLIDSGAGRSLLSPSWLEGQGIPPVFVEVPELPPQRVSWGGLWGTSGGLAPQARVDGMEISGLPVPMNDFLVLESELFGPPQTVGSCCDGILGTDFLKRFVVEFDTREPFELRFWPAEGFHLGSDAVWTELYLDAGGDAVSSCSAGPEGKSAPRLKGVRWDTGSEYALELHSPWRQMKDAGKYWELSCGGRKVADGIRPSAAPRGAEAGGPFAQRDPAMSVGMPLLERTSFFFDLPHGRIWFPKEASTARMTTNRSGLDTEFELVKGDRVLKVRSILPKTPAAALLKQGLKPGMVITQFDSALTSDLDSWEVERILSGARGDTVAVQWRTAGGLKMAPLEVR